MLATSMKALVDCNRALTATHVQQLNADLLRFART
jgi:hypothetical protein